MLSRRFCMRPRRFRRAAAAISMLALTVVVLQPVPAFADVSFINGRRSGAGLAAVSSSGALASLARSHSQRMADQKRLAHSGNLAARVSAVLSDWQAVAENVGFGASLAEVNASFMGSPGHRANILGNFNLAGVGIVTDDEGQVWVTQIFSRVAAGAAPAKAPGAAPAKAPGAAPAKAPAAARPRAPAPRRAAAASPERVVQPRASRARTSAPAPSRATRVAPPAPRQPATVAGIASPGGGYHLLTDDGAVSSFGAPGLAGGGLAGVAEPIVGGASTREGDGYVLFGRRGGVFAFGIPRFYGSAADIPLRGDVVAGALSSTGLGYTLFCADGGVLAFGDAAFHGSAADQALPASIVAGAVTPAGNGYWLAAADGSVYAFGSAPLLGSPADLGPLRAPIVGMATTPTGEGYWLAGADGGVFAFGDATFRGSAGDDPAPSGVRDIVAAASGQGYWLLRGDGEAIPFGELEVPVRRRPGTGPGSRLI